jgi:hypothetical protein
MFRTGRFGRLLAVLALALVACSPHRSVSPTIHAAASGSRAVIQVAFDTASLDAVVIKRSSVGELMTIDDGRRALQGPAVLALLVLVVIVGLGRQWLLASFDAARGGVLAATALARLRAPPLPR